MTNSTKKIVFVVSSNHAARTLLSSAALAEVEANYDLMLIASPEVNEPLPENSFVLGLPSLEGSFNRRLDRLFWFHALYVYMRRHRIRDEDSFKVSSLRWLMRRLHELLALPGLRQAVSVIDELYFRSDSSVEAALDRLRPQLLIVPGVAMDTYSHMFLRTAHRLGIPTLMIISHWDYFSKKGNLRVRPKKIYVWGNDMRESVVTKNDVPDDLVRIIGVPQFQKYLTALPSKAEAKASLGLDVSKHWLLFPGAGLPYDELAVLNAISERLQILGRDDVGIVYRPHPRPWMRKCNNPGDPTMLSNVVVDHPKLPGGLGDQHFRTLIAAVDGSISPISTMILEVGLGGGAALCLGFADNVNAWDFSQAVGFDHIRPLLDRNWVIPCVQRESLFDCLDVLLSRIGDANLHQRVKSEVKNTVFYDDETYAIRLHRAIDKDFFSGDGNPIVINA